MFTRPCLSLSDARKMVDFVLADVEREPGWEPGAVAVVDHEGALIFFAAEDDCNILGREVSINKAKTAAQLSSHTNSVRKRSMELGFDTFKIGIPFVTDHPGGICIYHPETGDVLGGIGCTHWGRDRDTYLPKEAIEHIGLVHEPPPDSRRGKLEQIKFGVKKTEYKVAGS